MDKLATFSAMTQTEIHIGNKINEIVDWITHIETQITLKKKWIDKLGINSSPHANSHTEVQSGHKSDGTVDYIDKLHYICKQYKDCDDCAFHELESTSAFGGCKLKNRNPEHWSKMKPEIDKAYSKIKSGLNGPFCEGIQK